MNCPECKCEETDVKDTRYRKGRSILRRRRQCRSCLRRFTTFELQEDIVRDIIKKDKTLGNMLLLIQDYSPILMDIEDLDEKS